MMVNRNPGLRGIELWRGIARGQPLYRLRENRPEYFLALREFLVRLHAGCAIADDARETESLQVAAKFDRVVLCGGDALDPRLASAFAQAHLPFTFQIDEGGSFSAERGAESIFRTSGWQRGVALDLGQLQLKVMAGTQRSTVPRDAAVLPFGATALEPSTARRRLRDFIGEGLRRATEASGAPDGVVLALPVALDANGVAEPATYPGLFGPVQSIFSDLFRCPWVVINDAVLAGLGFPSNGAEKTLVVTLGFGVGGALWTNDS